MLKKITHIVFATLLLLTTMGLMVSKHYCGGHMVSVSVFHQADTCCGDSGCCNDETRFFQVKDDFSAPAIFSVPVTAEFDLFAQLIWQAGVLLPYETEEEHTFISQTPPPLTVMEKLAEQQVYLL